MSNIKKTQPIHPLRQRMIEDMTLRGISETSQSGYIRCVRNCCTHLKLAPGALTAEEVVCAGLISCRFPAPRPGIPAGLVLAQLKSEVEIRPTGRPCRAPDFACTLKPQIQDCEPRRHAPGRFGGWQETDRRRTETGFRHQAIYRRLRT